MINNRRSITYKNQKIILSNDFDFNKIFINLSKNI